MKNVCVKHKATLSVVSISVVVYSWTQIQPDSLPRDADIISSIQFML